MREQFIKYQGIGDDIDHNTDENFMIACAHFNWKPGVNSPDAQDNPSSLVGAPLVAEGTPGVPARSGSGTRRPCCVSAALPLLMTGTGRRQVAPAADRETGLWCRSSCGVSPLYWNWNPFWSCIPVSLERSREEIVSHPDPGLQTNFIKVACGI